MQVVYYHILISSFLTAQYETISAKQSQISECFKMLYYNHVCSQSFPWILPSHSSEKWKVYMLSTEGVFFFTEWAIQCEASHTTLYGIHMNYADYDWMSGVCVKGETSLKFYSFLQMLWLWFNSNGYHETKCWPCNFVFSYLSGNKRVVLLQCLRTTAYRSAKSKIQITSFADTPTLQKLLVETWCFSKEASKENIIVVSCTGTGTTTMTSLTSTHITR